MKRAGVIIAAIFIGGCLDSDHDGVSNRADCDDTDSAVSPSATDACGDGIDNDCNNLPPSCVLSDELNGQPSWEIDTMASAVEIRPDRVSALWVDPPNAFLYEWPNPGFRGEPRTVVSFQTGRASGVYQWFVPNLGPIWFVQAPPQAEIVAFDDAGVRTHWFHTDDDQAALRADLRLDSDGLPMTFAISKSSNMRAGSGIYLLNAPFPADLNLSLRQANLMLPNERACEAPVIGDLYGDGVDDLLVGCGEYTRIFDDGASGALLQLEDADATIPFTDDFDLVGDLDGDGIVEMAVLGARLVWIPEAPTGLTSASLGEPILCNYCSFSGGELDADGWDDLVAVDAEGSDEQGTLYAAFGPFEPGPIDLRQDSDLFIATDFRPAALPPAIGDIDRDGLGDIAFGNYDYQIAVYATGSAF